MDMHMDVDKLYLGEYQFTVELDTGSETGGNQLTVWYAEKLPVETVPLKRFSLEQLLQALIEPYHTLLEGQLTDERLRCQEVFEAKIEAIRGSFVDEDGTALPLSSQARRQLRGQRHQRKQALRQLEHDFMQREMLALERKWFDPMALEKVSRVFGEGRFLRSFYFGEANEKYISNFCRKFALDGMYRREVLAGRARWLRRNALFYRNIPYVGRNEWSIDHAAKESTDARLYQLFLWIDHNCESILASPEYQRLLALDGDCELFIQGQPRKYDAGIGSQVEQFASIPGMKIIHACQGISGVVEYLDRKVLTTSSHNMCANLLLEVLDQKLLERIWCELPRFPVIDCEQRPNGWVRLCSISIKDNPVFRSELLELGRLIKEGVKQ